MIKIFSSVLFKDILLNVFMIGLMFATTKCEDYVYKCVRKNSDELICDAQNQEFDIKAEFEYLSANLSESEKQFKTLDILNSEIVEIPENVFLDISFTSIEILNAQNLTRIHTNAFNNNTAYNLQQRFFIAKPSNLSNSPPDYDLYKALSSLVNVADIEISLADGSHEIPDNAFQDINGPQNNLKYLVFNYDNYRISRIGNQSFASLPSLTFLTFSQIPIDYITAQSFDLNLASNDSLTINLNRCGISDDHIENGVFANAKRPLNIDLGKEKAK
jgi:hypothetical protein